MLPSNLKYGSKRESAQARSFTSRILPEQKSSGFAMAETISINIPCRVGQYLDTHASLLHFALKVQAHASNDTTVTLDSSGAHATFDRLRIIHGSNVLETIDDYGLISKILHVYNSNTGRLLVQSVMEGSGTVSNDSGSTYGVITAGTAKSAEFMINLNSLLGCFATNYLPLHDLSGGTPLRLELTIASSINQIVASDEQPVQASCSVDDVYYLGNFIEVTDDVSRAISGASGNAPSMSCPTFRLVQSQTDTLNTTETSLSVPINARFVSCRSFLSAFRSTASLNAVDYYPHACCRFGLNSYQYLIGNQLFPQQSPNSIEEQFYETIKATSGTYSDLSVTPICTVASLRATPASDAVSAPDLNSGNFICGLDLESYTSVAKSESFAGMNLVSTNTNLNVKFNGQGSSTPIRTSVFVMIDALYSFSQGVAVVAV